MTCDGTAIQTWRFQLAEPNKYTVLNQQTGRYLRIDGGSTNVGAYIVQFAWACDTDPISLYWTPTYDVAGGSWRLVYVKSGYSMDLFGGSSADGATIGQWTTLSNANQQWLFFCTSDPAPAAVPSPPAPAPCTTSPALAPAVTPTTPVITQTPAPQIFSACQSAGQFTFLSKFVDGNSKSLAGGQTLTVLSFPPQDRSPLASPRYAVPALASASHPKMAQAALASSR